MTSCTNFAPINSASELPPEPVMKMRQLSGVMPTSLSMLREKLQQLFRLAGLVTLVIAPDNLVAAQINHYRLHRSGADIQT